MHWFSKGLIRALLLATALAALSGCVYPAPGYYGYYDGPYAYPYYYGSPVTGTVVIGGGYRHWR